MELSRENFSEEFKLAGVRRLEEWVSIAEFSLIERCYFHLTELVQSVNEPLRIAPLR